MSTVPRKESGDSWSFRDGNVPFAIENAVYTSGDDTLTVSIGAGRARWADGTVFELSAATTDYTVSSPLASTTYHVWLDHAGTVTINTDSPPSTNADLTYLGSVTTASDTSVSSTSDGRGLLPLSGRTFLGEGTAAAPSLAFAGDPDVGIYQPSPGDLAIAINGVQVALFDSLGVDLNDTLNVDGDITFTLRSFGSSSSENGPTYSFTDDPDTGMYLTANGNLGFAEDGAVVARFASNAAVFEAAQVQAQQGSFATPSFAFEQDADTGMHLRANGQLGFSSNGEVVFWTDRVGDEARIYLGGESNDWMLYNPINEYFYFYIGDSPVGGYDSSGPFTGSNSVLGWGNAGSANNGDYTQFVDADNHYFFYADGSSAASNIHAGGFTNTSDASVKANQSPVASVRHALRNNVHPIEWDLMPRSNERAQQRRVSPGTAQEWQAAMGEDWAGVGTDPDGLLTLSLPAVDAALLAYCHELSDELEALRAEVDALQQA